ncbi:MAG: hypothetical protein P8P37_01675 [Candidatus Marinimicrobia bacterium]|nr:hypothetical protein [Candidatus Neomarinimicrobiota bacterium]
MPKKKKQPNISEKLNELFLEKDSLFTEIYKLTNILEENNFDKEGIINEIKKETKYIDDLLCMIINNKDDENKLNESLILFYEEYNGKINNIFNLVTEEISRMKHLKGS